MKITRLFMGVTGTFLAMASTGYGGLTVRSTKVDVVVNGTAFDRYDVVVTNDAIGTGTQLLGMQYAYSGSKAFFQVDDTANGNGVDGVLDGIPDTLSLLSTRFTRIRAASGLTHNSYVDIYPENEFAQPNPYLTGVTAFSGGVISRTNTVATGAGFQVARIFVLDGGWGTFSGRVAGNIGPQEQFSVTLAPDRSGSLSQEAIIFTDEAKVVRFAPGSGPSIPFDAQFAFMSAEAFSVHVDPVAGVSDLVLKPSSGYGVGDSFNVTGRIDSSHIGKVVYLPFRVRQGESEVSDAFTFVVLPEPTSLASLGLCVAICRRVRSRAHA